MKAINQEKTIWGIMKIIEELFKNIEKVLRYLVPAFVFTILLRHFNQNSYEEYVSTLNKMEFVFYFILLGITIYSIHRVVFEAIDYIYIKFIKKKSVTEFISNSFKMDEELRNYFYFKCATIHSVLITTELVIIFILIRLYGFSFSIFVILFVIALIVYVGYLVVQTKLNDGLGERKKSKP